MHRRLLRLLPVVTTFWILGAAEVVAQAWDLEASVGQTAHELSPQDAELGAAMRLRYSGAPWIYAAGGAPFSGRGMLWAAIGAGDRLSTTRGPVTFGLDAGAHGHGYLDSASEVAGTGAVLEAMPLLSVAAGPLRLQARSGGQYYGQWQGQQEVSRSVHASDGVLSLSSSRGRVSGSARYVRAAEADYPYLGGAVQAYVGPAVVWTTLGRWFTEEAQGADWSAGARLQVRAGLDLYASYQRDAFHPLYLNPTRESWSIGLSRRLGPSPAGLVPVPVPLPLGHASGVTFRLPLSLSGAAPSLAGDFTGWLPVAMSREGEFWTVTVAVEPGVHAYSFVRPDGSWFVPAGLPVRDDGFGGSSAVLIVQ